MRSNFQERLGACARLTEQRLGEILADRPQTPERLMAAARHGVLGGGKRIRPFLVLEGSRMLGVGEDAALAVAAALECVHCYSLVHDDLPAMDNDRLRRGRPTVWAAYDDWTAILVGDGLLTLAFEIIADTPADISDRARVEVVAALARAAGFANMVGGQYLDMAAERAGQTSPPDETSIRRLQAMKTGALILFGAAAGAILAGNDPPTRKALTRYGRSMGLAFQIADDLIDAEGDAAVTGKAVGKDAAAGKATLVGLYGPERAREALARAHDEAVGALAPFGASADMLRALADFIVVRDR